MSKELFLIIAGIILFTMVYGLFLKPVVVEIDYKCISETEAIDQQGNHYSMDCVGLCDHPNIECDYN